MQKNDNTSTANPYFKERACFWEPFSAKRQNFTIQVNSDVHKCQTSQKNMMNEHKDLILNYSRDKLGQRKNIEFIH